MMDIDLGDEKILGDVLIAEDDADVARLVIAPFFRSHWSVHLAHSIPQARDRLEEIGDLRLALIDLNMPGGRPFGLDKAGGGFEVIEWINQQFDGALVVVLTAYVSASLINTAQALGAEFMVKENFSENLRDLEQRALTFGRSPAGVREYAMRLQRLHGLTDRQVEVVALAISGRRNPEIAEALSVSINTVKGHIRAILTACDELCLADIARAFWRGEFSD